MLPQILWVVLHVLAIAAAPVKDAPLAKLKIRKLPTRREGENVHEAFQRHYTQALRRHAHLTGRAPPTHEMLVESMRKRVSYPRTEYKVERRKLNEKEDHLLRAGHIKKRLWFAETDPTAPSPVSRSVDKRLWFPGTAANATGAGSVLLAGSEHGEVGQELHAGSLGGDDDFGGFGGLGGNGGAGNGGGGKGGGGAGNGGTGKASAASTAAAASITVSESGSNANGFSQTDLDLLENDTLTKSTSDLVSGGLGFIIEGADTSYVADIQMGTPPQSFVMIMDTGSSDTWVPDSACTDCGNHLSLGADSSSSFQGSNSAFQVTYGSGAVAGTLCQDTMTIAGMALDNHTFGTVTQESSQFSSGLSDGLMGLAFSSLSEQQTDTPVDSLVSAGLIKQGILGVALGRVDDGENIGELVFGQADTSKFDASTTQTLDVTSTDGFWQTAMAAVQVNGQAVVANRQAIHDTGTTLIVAPSADATAFHAQIQGAQSAGDGTFTIPCTTNAAVFMQFGDAAFQIDPRDLIFEPVSNDLQGDCISGIMAGTVTDDQTWLLGDVMLKNVYMTTNVQDRTVSFSARTDVPGSSAASAAKNNAVAAAATGDGSSSSTGRKIKVTTKTSLGGLAAAVGALAARWRM